MFRGDIAGSSENRQGAGEVARGVEPFGQAEIAHERFAVSVEEDISGFEVAVKDSFAVCVLDGARDLGARVWPRRGLSVPGRVFARA